MKQRKTVILQIDPPGQLEPSRYRVLWETPDMLEVDGGRLERRVSLSKLPDGRWVNENGCKFVEVKADRRPKPFSVTYRDQGRTYGQTVKKFATLAEAAEYCWAQYEGVEYFDGAASFHNDYGCFDLAGFVLADIYEIDYPGYHATKRLKVAEGLTVVMV
jgi:hypothetical protein